MSSEGPRIYPHELNIQATEMVDEIWGKFSTWRSTTTRVPSLAVPQELSPVFIPKELYLSSGSPKNVKALLSSSDTKLNVSLYETMPVPVTDKSLLNVWLEEGQKKPVIDGSQYNATWAPEGVDYMHLRYLWELGSGQLSPHDKVYLKYIVKMIEPGIAYTVNYFDRPEMRGKGISRGFFARLDSILKTLDYKYVVGQVASPNPKFFEKGTTPYGSLPLNIKEQLPAALADDQLRFPNNTIVVRSLQDM